MQLQNLITSSAEKLKVSMGGITMTVRAEPSSGDILDAMFSHQNGSALKNFMYYLTAQGSPENLLCYVAIKDYERFANSQKGLFIIQNFVMGTGSKRVEEVRPDGPMQVNLDARTERRLLQERGMFQRRRGHGRESDIVVSSSFFDQALGEIQNNLIDTIERYRTGYTYSSANARAKGYGCLVRKASPTSYVFAKVDPAQHVLPRVRSMLGEMRQANMLIPAGLQGI